MEIYISITYYSSIGVYALLAVNDCISHSLTRSYLVTRQRMTPPGEIVVLQYSKTFLRITLIILCMYRCIQTCVRVCVCVYFPPLSSG